jgi:hypothetical protein
MTGSVNNHEGAGTRGKRRRYYVLRELDNGHLEPLSWYEDARGIVVSANTPGAIETSEVEAVNTEAALAVGFAAVGEPVDGARLIAVAALHFQAKMVRSKPPTPRPPNPSRLEFV